MAARIAIARLKSDPVTQLKACDYKPDIHRGNVLCPFDRCRCELSGVQASTRNVNGEQVAVEAFFRLPSNAEKAGQGHKPGCRYNVEKTVKRLVALSRKITHLDENAEPLLTATRTKIAEFRLHILMEQLPSLRAMFINAVAESSPAACSSTGTAYIRSDQLQKPYLRVAKAILSFVARIQKRSELAEWIRLKYENFTISWDDYFYDIGDYAALYQYLTKLGQLRPRLGHDRPVALAVRIISGAPTRTQYGHWQVRGRAEPCKNDAGEAFVIRPVLYSADKQLADQIAAQSQVLVCGIPTLAAPWRSSNANFKPRVDVSMDIISRGQVCRYSPMMRNDAG